MFLLADRIRLHQPLSKLFVDVARAVEPEHVQVIARGESLDAAEARRLEPSRQHDVSVEPAAPRCHLRKRHPDLERDAGLFGQDTHGPGRLEECDDAFVEGANAWRLVAEMIVELALATGVRLIAIRKLATAFSA